MKLDQEQIWNEGSTQKQRAEQVLKNPTFKVDEREFDDLLKEVINYSEIVSFNKPTNIDNGEPTASWHHLLEVDELAVLSQLKLLDVKSIEADFYRHYTIGWKASNTFTRRHIHYAVFAANSLARKLLRWGDILSKIPNQTDHHAIYEEWNQALIQVPKIFILGITDFNQKIADERSATLEQIIKYLLTWQSEIQSSGKISKKSFPFRDLGDLDRYFKTLLKTAIFLNSNNEYFMKLAKEHATHEPHNALLFAFLELFGSAQQKLNRFHERHLVFYYRKLLALNVKALKADETVLTFKLEDEIKNSRLKKDTKFIGGQTSNGDNILYETLNDLQLDQSAIKFLRGVHLKKEEANPNATFDILTRNYSLDSAETPWPIMEVAAGSKDETHSADVGFVISSPNFDLRDGNRQITLSFEGSMEVYALDPKMVRALKKESTSEDGKKVKLDPKLSEMIELGPFSENPELTLESFLAGVYSVSAKKTDYSLSSIFYKAILARKELANASLGGVGDTLPGELRLSELLRLLKDDCNIDHEASLRESMEDMLGFSSQKIDRDRKRYQHRKFRRLFLEAFKISYTSEGGWSSIKPASVEFYADKFSYNLTVVVVADQDKPSFIKNNESGFESPALRFLINKDAPTYPYDFLSKINPYQIKCNIEVTGLKNLALYNQIGQLNPDGAFLPFGPSPNNYSYFLIGSQEVFRKKPKTINLNLEWMDLPAFKGGFKTHYSDYKEPFENSEYKADVSLLVSGSWGPDKEKRQEVELFRGDDFLDSKVMYNVDTNHLDLSSNFEWNPEELTFDKLSRRGFLKLQLTSPSYSFGHDIYPGLLSQMVMESASKMTGLKSMILGKKNEMDLPSLPYTPKLSKVSLDYTVNFSIDFRTKSKSGKNKANKFFHIEPFGGKQQVEVTNNSCDLIPSFPFEGALFIGVEGGEFPCQVTLFFHLIEREAASDQDIEEVDWSILIANEWRRLKRDQITMDTTDGLIHSGIVRLDIPRIKSFGNSLLENGLLWIRASVDGGSNILGNVVSIHNHAVGVKRILSGRDDGVPFILRETIDTPENDLPKLKEIMQPIESYFGTPEEHQDKFRIRISERLRHKNRFVNLYDYERIILEAFPTVNKVLCVNTYNRKELEKGNRGIRSAGNVLIVLVPLLSDHASFNLFSPKNSVNTLRRVRELLESKSSAFVSFEVINPIYEPVRIFSRVGIKSEFPTGSSLKLLNKELKEFISPWIANPLMDPMFQRKLALEEVQSFIQSRPYIDFVTKISMVKAYQEILDEDPRDNYRLSDTGISAIEDNEIQGRYPWSILTSANHHTIELMSDENTIPANNAGLDELYLDEDFVIPQNDN